ncbi:MAG: glycine/betaine ABC transporter substrate-binding protein, partial [Chloroflexota bacterium]
MAPFLRSQRAKPLVLLSIIAMLLLAACGGSSSSGTTSGGTPSNSSITLKVGGKLDTEAQLLTKMYVLLLKKAGFNVIEKS